MVHIHYDFSLVVGSIAVAILASYLAISTQQFLLGGIRQKSEKAMLLLSGLCLGVAIWGMHFVGMLACQLPANYAFNLPLTVFFWRYCLYCFHLCHLADHQTHPAFCPSGDWGGVNGTRHFRHALYRYAGHGRRESSDLL